MKQRIKPYSLKDLNFNINLDTKLESIFEYTDEEQIKLLKKVDKDLQKCDVNIIYYQNKYKKLLNLKKVILKNVSK